MKSLWNKKEAEAFSKSPLAMRAYSSRLLGRDPALVLHGGGNTSLKVREPNFFGDTEHILYVKGSGWDLASIEPQGFAPVKMDVLLRLATLERLSDSEMVSLQRSAMKLPDAPNPSVEAILHAIIPHAFIDHTHADAVVAVTNSPGGEARIREVYGDSVIYIPYVMPGFLLARKVFELTRDLDWRKFEGMVLLNHGIFSFGDGAEESYERMINLVTKAESYLSGKKAFTLPKATPATLDPLQLARLRKAVSRAWSRPVVARACQSGEAVAYSSMPKLASVASRGPLTPDHVIHTKRIPLLLTANPSEVAMQEAVSAFGLAYRDYFTRNKAGRELQCLDSAPRWAVWPGVGTVAFSASAVQANVVADITEHTVAAQTWAEALGGWVALPENEIFDVEYWELEQAKLKKKGSAGQLQGKIALVTGAAGGIGKATVNALRAQGAAVIAVDISPKVKELWGSADVFAIQCDLTKRPAVDAAVKEGVAHFGGLDILVPNAGIFPASQTIDSIDDESWDRSLGINLTSQLYLFRACAPFLELGIDPTIVVVASKNVVAPGPGAAAYSAAKAGLTQLARVAALELGPKGVRVNMLHPHAVLDTGIWSPEVLESRAKASKMTVEDYKRNNLLKVEVCSKDVGDLVAAMAGPLFSKTTGAQISVDGGSDRVV